ncbi:MAG: hypothetical protein ABIH72_02900 [archaeon]
MAELQFNYEKTCACLPAVFKLKNTEHEKYLPLILSSILGSLSTPETPEFQAQFENSPDNLETQVDMYATLLDNVCVRLSKGIKRLEADEKKAQELSSEFENMVRAVYATLASSELVPLKDDTALFAGYLIEKFGDKKPTTEIIEASVNTYLEKLKVKEYLDEQGVTAQLIANLEAAL